jgi:predicted nucleic acid-binding protein
LIYVDTSALIKLVKPEVHSDTLAAYLDVRDDLVSSSLLAVELRRGALRSAPRTLPRADLLLTRVEMIEMDATVVEAAGRLPDPMLRTLDAIHLATALLIRDEIDVLLTYDERLAEAARRHRVPTAAPA